MTIFAAINSLTEGLVKQVSVDRANEHVITMSGINYGSLVHWISHGVCSTFERGTYLYTWRVINACILRYILNLAWRYLTVISILITGYFLMLFHAGPCL